MPALHDLGTSATALFRAQVILGQGSFDRVRLALHKPINVAYALKGMRKGALVRNRQIEHDVNERRVLAMCDHPFILKLAAVFTSATQACPPASVAAKHSAAGCTELDSRKSHCACRSQL
jgi:serine/threonine protein kinase